MPVSDILFTIERNGVLIDANMLNAKGVPAVNLGIGAQNPHGDDEFILIEDLFKTAEIADQIIVRSAQFR